MPKRKVQFVKGAYYHIYNRGSGRELIFREADNYLFVLRKIKEYAAQYHIAIIAYCLMPNHYHFLVRQDDETSVGLLPQHVFNSYTKAFNKRYERSGTLFEGRFQAIRVNKENYLIHLCRYIHGNPVRAGLVIAPEGWVYSNYLEWIAARNGTLVDRNFIANYFPRAADYHDFVQEYLESESVLPDGINTYLFR